MKNTVSESKNVIFLLNFCDPSPIGIDNPMIIWFAGNLLAL